LDYDLFVVNDELAQAIDCCAEIVGGGTPSDPGLAAAQAFVNAT
jgi:hypothetical protein